MNESAEGIEHPIRFESFRHRARNPFRFRGKGAAAVHAGAVGLEGKRSIPFWFSKRETVIVPLTEIINVARSGKAVTFELMSANTGTRRRTQPVKLLFRDEASANAFADALPLRATWEHAERREYHDTLYEYLKRPLVIPALVVLNVAVYALFSTKTSAWINADPKKLLDWGSNFGPFVTNGQWWRLFTAMFLHGGLLHLAVNMFALYDTGRLCERLYGHARLLAIYLLSGLAGSVASVWWNPMVNSVGASGAIFGVFGALFVYMLDPRHGVPASIMQKHLASTGLFITYALYSGWGKTAVDNAAHVGGLVGGLLLGWSLARPLNERTATSAERPKAIVGTAAIVLTMVGLMLATPNSKQAYDLTERFAGDTRWFEEKERRLVGRTKTLLERIRQGKVALGDTQHEIVAIAHEWGEAHSRLAAYRIDRKLSGSDLAELQMDLILYADSRHRAMRVFAAAASQESNDTRREAQQLEEFTRLTQDSAEISKRMSERAKAMKEKRGKSAR